MKDDGAEQAQAGWKRPLAYLILLAGGLLTVFNGEVGRGLNISNTIVQFAALGLLLAGAALFFSVRERSDRVSSYRQVFTRTGGVPEAASAALDNQSAGPEDEPGKEKDGVN